jgi:hypothetical protein
VKDSGGSTLATYKSDPVGRRVQEVSGGVTTDLFYSSSWQVLEEREAALVREQYVWAPTYVDALVLRDRDATGDGRLEERLWVQQDGNYTVTGLLDGSSNVVERYAYDPFGTATVGCGLERKGFLQLRLALFPSGWTLRQRDYFLQLPQS